MVKIKKSLLITLSLILTLTLALLGLSFLKVDTSAEATIAEYEYNGSINSEGVWKLYGDTAKTKSLWALSGGSKLGSNETSNDTLHYYRKGGVLFGSPAGTYTSNVNFSQEIVNAVNNGYAKVRVSAYMWNESRDGGFTNGQGNLKLISQGSEVANTGNFTYGTSNTDFKSLELTRLNGTNLSVVFWGEANGGLGSYCSTNYFVKQPTIEVIWDKTAPTIDECTISNPNWYNQNKTLKIVTSDDYSGIKSVFVNGTEITGSIDENPTPSIYYGGNYLKRTYEYEITQNGTYNIVVTDVTGKQTTTSYTETKIDKSVPVNPILIAPTDWIYDGFSINAMLNNAEDISGSPLKYYYTIDGSTPDKNSNEMVLGEENTIDFGGNGRYTLNVIAIDDAGNQSEVISHEIKIDNTRYKVVASEKTGILSASIENLSGREEFLRGDTIKITLNKDADYRIFGSTINGQDITLTEEDENTFTFTFVIDDKVPYFADTFNFDFIVKEVLQVSIKQDTYTFEEGGNVLDYKVVSNKASNIDIVKSNLSVEYLKDGVATTFFESGEYQVNFVFENAEFFLNYTQNVVICKKQINVKLDSTSSVYDGTTKQVLINEEDIAELKEFNKEYVISSEEILNAGTYKIVISVANDDKNYIPQEIEYVVEKMNLTLGLGNIRSKQFDDEEKVLEYSVISGQIIAGDLSDLKVVRAVGENVGTYQTSLEYTENSNYNITYLAEDFEITKRIIKVNFEDNTRDYELGLHKQDLINGLKYSFENLSANVTKEMIENALIFDIKDFNEEFYYAGTYKVVNIGEAQANFEFELVNANITFSKMLAYINPKVSKTAIYGDEIIIEILSVEGIPADKVFLKLDGDENLTIERIIVDGKIRFIVRGDLNVGIKNVVLDTDKMEEVYLNNYELVLWQKSVEILPRPVEVALEGSTTKVYGERDNMPNIVVNDAKAQELLNNSNVEISISREKGENVGSYEISLESSNDSNFNISLDKTYTYEITKKELVVTPDAISKIYGENDAEISYTVNGLVNGDTADSVLSGSLSREEGENVGSYEILIGSLTSLDDNYSVELNEQKAYYNIEKADFKIELENFETTYNGNLVAVEINSELPISIKYFKDGNEVKPLNAGDYIVKVSTTDSNYNQNEITTRLKINKAVLFVELPSESYYYTGEKIEYSGKVEGFDFEINYYYSNGDKVEGDVIKAGIYTVEMVFNGNENYSSNTFKTTLNVIKKSVFINIEKDTFIYDGEIKTPIYSTSNNEIEAKISYYIVGEDGKEQRVLEPVGSADSDTVYRYVIEIENDEYKGSFSGTMTIKKREVIVGDGFVIEVADKKDLSQELSFEIQRLYSKTNPDIKTQNVDFTTYTIKNKEVEEIYKVTSNDTSLENTYLVKIPVGEMDKDKLSLYIRKDGSMVEVKPELVGSDLVIETNDVNMEVLIFMAVEPQTFADMALRILAAFVGIGFLSFLTLKIRYKKKPIFFKSKFSKFLNKSKKVK